MVRRLVIGGALFAVGFIATLKALPNAPALKEIAEPKEDRIDAKKEIRTIPIERPPEAAAQATPTFVEPPPPAPPPPGPIGERREVNVCTIHHGWKVVTGKSWHCQFH